MMDHLPDDRLLDVARGDGTAMDQAHLSGCSTCRGAVEEWRTWLEDLRAVARESIDDVDRHRLATLFRHRAGVSSSPGIGGWIAALVRDLRPAAVGVRSSVVPRLQEHEAGPYRLVLQLQLPTADRGASIHGHVESDTADVAGHVVMTSSSGQAFVSPVDEFGEFDLQMLPPGEYRASWFLPLGRVTLESLRLTDDDLH